MPPTSLISRNEATLSNLGLPIDVRRLREEILSWMTPPSADRGGRVAGRQIRRLVEALDEPSGREDRFLSTVAEAVLARRLLEDGCAIDIERPTAGGRHADFFVRASNNVECWVHVKRVGAPHAMESSTPLPPVLSQLSAMKRPVAIAVRWSPTAAEAQLLTLRNALEPFVREASVGDEVVVRAEDGAWLGAARIVAPTAEGTVTVRTGVDAGWEAAIPRVQRLLRKAYSQFMPGAVNVICIASDSPAALGTIIERWDRFPPRGHRVAHGRAEDGFWARGQYEMSSLVAWFPVDGSAPAHIWERAPHGTPHVRDGAVAALMSRVLGTTREL
ncbi:MAG: hypothetical protein EBR07_07910 [Planctomycetes bacterium]|nr:hypothetical protein [Planctomycetota bacterium]